MIKAHILSISIYGSLIKVAALPYISWILIEINTSCSNQIAAILVDFFLSIIALP